jgi:hypothetical protein
LIFVCTGLGFAQEKRTVEPVKKVYAIYVAGEMRSASYILEDIEAAEFNGIKCLKGKHVDLYWVANRIVYIPVDKISMIIEYNSLSQFKEDIEKYHKKELER